MLDEWINYNYLFFPVLLMYNWLQLSLTCLTPTTICLSRDGWWSFVSCKVENSSTLATWCEALTHWKRPWCWEGLRAGGEEDDRGWDGWMASPTRWAWVWVNSLVGDGQGGLACCDSWGHKELHTTERLNWTELNWR